MEKIAVILINWNGYLHTLQCINSLKQVQHKGLEIIVVDNDSEASEVSHLRALVGITLLEQSQNLGFTGGNNVGIKYAIKKGADAIMLLNNDTTVEPDFLFPLLNELAHQQVAAVQPKIHTMQSANTIWNAGGVFNFLLARREQLGRVNLIELSLMNLRRSTGLLAAVYSQEEKYLKKLDFLMIISSLFVKM